MRCALSQLEREKQIALKAKIKAEEEAEERRIAEQMERDRVAALHVSVRRQPRRVGPLPSLCLASVVCVVRAAGGVGCAWVFAGRVCSGVVMRAGCVVT